MTNLNNTCSYATAVKSSLCWNIVPNEVKDYFQFSPNEATMYISTPFTPQDGMVIVSQFPKHEAITSARPFMNYRGIYFAGAPYEAGGEEMCSNSNFKFNKILRYPLCFVLLTLLWFPLFLSRPILDNLSHCEKPL